MPKGVYKRETEAPVDVALKKPKIEAGNNEVHFAVSIFSSQEGWRWEILKIRGEEVLARRTSDPDLKIIIQHQFLRLISFLGSEQLGQFEDLLREHEGESHA